MREPSKGFTRELQVGIFIFAACLVIAAFSFRITDTPIFRKGTTLITFLDDATGVFRNSKVKMAGIDIGVIKEITLEGGKARIRMLINHGVDIPENAQVVPRPLGILGDKYLEVVVPVDKGKLKDKASPTEKASPIENQNSSKYDSNVPDSSLKEFLLDLVSAKAWAQQSPPTAIETPNAKISEETLSADEEEAKKKKKKKGGNFKEGEVIQSLNTPATLDDLTRQMGNVGEDLKAISGTLRQIVESDDQPNTTVGKTLRNAEKLSGNVNAVVQENRKDLREMISTLNRVSKKIEKAMDGFDEDKMRKDIGRLADAVGNVNESLENVKKVTSRIEKGEGTVGKLINDPTTALELNRALSSINVLVDRAARTQTIVDLNTEYAIKPEEYKTYVSLFVLPREESGYIGQVIIDPNGTTEKVIKRVSVDGAVETVTEEVTNDLEALKFSLQYYKRIHALSFRLGIFENRGGLGADIHLLKDKVSIGAELFDFSRIDNNAFFKTYAKIHFMTHFYATIGGNDLLSKNPARKSFQIGIGLRFVDDDLKALSLLPSVN